MTSWRDATFAVIDLETTGLDPAVNEVLSVGIVELEPAQKAEARRIAVLAIPAQMRGDGVTAPRAEAQPVEVADIAQRIGRIAHALHGFGADLVAVLQRPCDGRDRKAKLFCNALERHGTPRLRGSHVGGHLKLSI